MKYGLLALFWLVLSLPALTLELVEFKDRAVGSSVRLTVNVKVGPEDTGPVVVRAIPMLESADKTHLVALNGSMPLPELSEPGSDPTLRRFQDTVALKDVADLKGLNSQLLYFEVTITDGNNVIRLMSSGTQVLATMGTGDPEAFDLAEVDRAAWAYETRTVCVLFATNRALDLNESGLAKFTGALGPVRYGQTLVNVTLPVSQASVGQPSRRKYRIAAPEFLTPAKWEQRIREQQGSALLFVFGFSKSVGDAFQNAAQFMVDTNLEGTCFPVVFLWPDSDNLGINVPGAFKDAYQAAILSRKNLTDLMALILTIKPSLQIITHSLGTEVTLGALQLLNHASRVGEVVIAAPASEKNKTESMLSAIQTSGVVGGLTHYFDPNDRVLDAASRLPDIAAPGQRAGTQPIPLDAVDNILCTRGTGDWLFKHSTYTTSSTLLKDIGNLLRHHQRASQRLDNLRQVDGKSYFRIIE